MSQPGMNTVRKVIVFGLIGFFFCTIAWTIYLDYYFYAYSPRSPDPSNGFVYQAKVHHGATVYLNAKQWRWFSPAALNITYAVGFLALILCAILSARWKIWGNRNGVTH
jgi:hypothetical protein